VDSDLTNRVEGVPERFAPASVRGELTDAEHLIRYAWAARLAPGKRVLDAGCGLGYGSHMLRRAGAAEVVGVDLAESVVEAAGGIEEPGLRFEVGDVGDLDHRDGAFDLVVCLEVIEHVHDQRRVMSELVRVLAPDGVLVMSSPNRAAYVPGNPHHVHEYLPEELHAALSESLEHVQLWRQHNWICSAILDDATFAADDLAGVRDLWVEKVAGAEPGRETYTMALASNAPLPEPAPGALLTGTAEVRKWLELYDEQQAILHAQAERIDGFVRERRELGELRERLAEAERKLAEVPLDSRDPAPDGAVVELAARVEAAERNLANVLSSPSWRITAPLRTLKNSLKRRSK
jgi:2-polyprenyl-3-methyl-5-hydroxy-6-metoxy-1,4-benzoquinol methylase